jgi:hypothetical protein
MPEPRAIVTRARSVTSRLQATQAALATLAALILAACGSGAQDGAGAARSATLILHGGNVVTMNEAHPAATAVAIAGDRIIFVGDDAGAMATRGDATRIVDLDGATAVPGLTDAHAHLMGVGRLSARVDVLGSTSYAELLDAVSEVVARAEPGDWIVGRGWHQEKWTDAPPSAVRGFPTNEDLNRIAPDNPVSISHASGHGTLANDRALEAANITAQTPDPPGGEILRLPGGRPSGMLIENAEGPVEKVYQAFLAAMSPAERMADERQALRLGVEEFLQNGITEVHDPGVEEATFAMYREALDAGELDMRIYAMLSEDEATDESLARLRTVGAGDHRLSLRAIKAYADGALGSRGALLLEPYTDDDSRGQEVLPRARLEAVAELALRHGYQYAIHAIGDAANRRALDIYADAFARHPDEAGDVRFRIEHSQIVHPDDIQRFAELGVIAAMQGVHSTSDGPWTPTRLGDQRSHDEAFPFRDLWDAGVLIVNGTDAPVERIAPWASIAGMTVGLTNEGEVFNPHHLLTRREALATYTINPARAAFEEDLRGSLEVGKLGDVTVVDRDPLTAPDAALAETRTLMTVVGGDVVFEAEVEADAAAAGAATSDKDVSPLAQPPAR